MNLFMNINIFYKMADKNLIGILGKKSSGKDTCGEYLIENYNYKRYAFADPIKKITKILFDLNEDQLYGDECKDALDFKWYINPRDAFQKIGTEFGQKMIYDLFPKLKQKLGDEIIWVKLFKVWYEKNKNNNIIITDVRFPHEIEAIKSMGGIIVKINRDINDNYNDNINDNINNINDIINKHITEQSVDNSSNIPDIYFNLDNNNTKVDLYSQLDTLINLIKLNNK